MEGWDEKDPIYSVNTDGEEEADVLGTEWDFAKAKEAGLRMKGARMRSLGVFVVGDCVELGEWCVERAIQLSHHRTDTSEDPRRVKKSNAWCAEVEINESVVGVVEYRYFIGQVLNGKCDSVHSWEANPLPRILRVGDKPPGVSTYGRYGGSSCVEAGWLGSQQSEVQLRIHGNDAMTLDDDDEQENGHKEFYIKCLPIDVRLRRSKQRGREVSGQPPVSSVPPSSIPQQSSAQYAPGLESSFSLFTAVNGSKLCSCESSSQQDNGVLAGVAKEQPVDKATSEVVSKNETPVISNNQDGKVVRIDNSADGITEYITSDVQVTILTNTKRSLRSDPPPIVNHPYPQPIEGVPYSPGDFVTFRLRTRKPSEIGFKITICLARSSDDDDDTKHGKSGRVIGTAFVGRCPAEKSKQISDCVISNDFEPVGMLKVDVLVIRPSACVQSRTGLRLGKPWSTPAPSPKRMSPVNGEMNPPSSLSRSLVIGHRGMGSTFSSGVPSAKVTENTIASFERAIHHGADMIEFDVILTKDMVPVVYHDFVTFVKATNKSKDSKSCQISLEKCCDKKTTAVRIPIQDLTLEELMELELESAAERDYRMGYEKEKCRHDSGVSCKMAENSSNNFTPILADDKIEPMVMDINGTKVVVPKVIDNSVDNLSLCSEEVAAVMSAGSEARKEEAYDSDRSVDSGYGVDRHGKKLHTHGAVDSDCRCVSPAESSKSCNAIKAHQHHQPPFMRSPCKFERPFPTLKECFTSLDPRCGFNVEVKHSMQLAAGPFEDDIKSTVELNDYVDAILAVVYEYASEGGRPVVFSSFDPDICIMLRLKQNLFAVLFLSQGEHPDYPPFADTRTRSVADAIQFARSENILGVDLCSRELLSDLQMVKHVKSSALSVYCWGADNNNRDNMKRLEEAGVDAIILDRCDEFIA